jgi:hypothetical protein
LNGPRQCKREEIGTSVFVNLPSFQIPVVAAPIIAAACAR